MTKQNKVVKAATTQNKAAKKTPAIVPTKPKLKKIVVNHYAKGNLPKGNTEFRSYGIALMSVFNIVKILKNSVTIGKPTEAEVRAFARCWSPFGYHKNTKQHFTSKGMTAKGNNAFLVEGKMTIESEKDTIDKYVELVKSKTLPTKGNWISSTLTLS